MHAYLVHGVDGLEQSVNAIIKSAGALAINHTIAKIQDVGDLKKTTKLVYSTPIAVICRDFDKASSEAQNALLKTLEEPANNITFILTARSLSAILPTVISRCRVIKTGTKYAASEKFGVQVANFIKGDTPTRLKIAEGVRTKAEALTFLDDLILYSHGNLLRGKINPIAIYGPTAAANIWANGNVGLQLTSFILHLE